MVRTDRARAVAFVLAAGIAFSTSGPLARSARPEHPVAIALGRVAIASLVLFALDARGVLRGLAAAPRRARTAVIASGALLGAHFACFLLGLDLTSLPAAIALVSLEPLSVVVAAWLAFGDRPTRGEALGVLVATAGAVVVARGAGSGEHRLVGDLLVVAAVVLYGAYVAAARAMSDAIAPRASAAAVYAVAAVVLVPILAWAPARAGSVIVPVPAHAAVAIVALALVPTLIGHTSVQAAARTLPPSTVALVSPGETVFGIAISAFVLGAWPTATEWAGAALVVLGATLAILGSKARSNARELPRATDDQPPGEGGVEQGPGMQAQR